MAVKMVRLIPTSRCLRWVRLFPTTQWSRPVRCRDVYVGLNINGVNARSKEDLTVFYTGSVQGRQKFEVAAWHGTFDSEATSHQLKDLAGEVFDSVWRQSVFCDGWSFVVSCREKLVSSHEVADVASGQRVLLSWKQRRRRQYTHVPLLRCPVRLSGNEITMMSVRIMYVQLCDTSWNLFAQT